MNEEVIQEQPEEMNLDEQESQEDETSSEEREENVSEEIEETSDDDNRRYTKAQFEQKFEKKRKQLDRKYRRELDSLERDILAKNLPQQQIEIPQVPQDEVEVKIQAALQRQRQLDEQERTTEQQRQAEYKLQRKIDDAHYKYDDYEDVLKDTLAEEIWTNQMEQASHLTDNAPDFAYKAAKHHRDELRRISKLSPKQQVTEMILLADRIKKPRAKKVTKAPEPIKKIVSNSSGSALKDVSNLSFEERVKMLRNKGRR